VTSTAADDVVVGGVIIEMPLIVDVTVILDMIVVGPLRMMTYRGIRVVAKT